MKKYGLSQQAKDALYETMRPKDIVNLPIRPLADDNCVLFLWVMDSQIQLAFDVIKHWGFVYKTVAFTWVKLTKRPLAGFFIRNRIWLVIPHCSVQ